MDMIIVVCFDEHNFLGRDIFSGLLIRITDRLNCLKIKLSDIDIKYCDVKSSNP